MREHFLDPEVFIRSLASRGGLGGVPPSIRGAIHLLDAMGKEIIFIETIGVGQDEVEISTLAHTVVVVLNPWMGDEVQGMKAGLLEIADILAVNKADLPGAEQMVQQLRGPYEDPGLLILQTSATKNEGISLLLDGIERHQARILASGDHRTRRLNFCRQELVSLLQERMFNKALKGVEKDSMERLVQKIAERELDPYTAVQRMAKKMRL
jgi:LAO/AO transport system kinase